MTNLFDTIMAKNRLGKFHFFMGFFKPTKENSVLDVGVNNSEYMEADNLFEKKYPFKHKITCLGIGRLDDFAARYPNIKVIGYDGKIFPFKDNSFDFIWCNAVIEHVGDKDRQQLFLSEIIRVAKKRIFITTPNKGFPIEAHTHIPLFHWLPKPFFDWVAIMIGKQWATGNYMHLLYRKDVIMLLENTKKNFLIDYAIYNNRLLGFTATFSVVINKRDS